MIIETTHLTKIFGQKTAILDINLKVGEGEMFAILGLEGAGKTTLLRLLMNFLQPTSGRAEIFGLRADKKGSIIREKTGYIPQSFSLPVNWTGEEFLNFVVSLRPGRPDYRSEIASALELDLKKKISSYSREMKQKLIILQAFAHEPKLLVMDEPFSELSALARKVFYDLLQEKKGRGATVLLTASSIPDVDMICNRVGIMHNGHFLAEEDNNKFREKQFKIMEMTAEAEVDFSQISGVMKAESRNDFHRLKVKGDIMDIMDDLQQYSIRDVTVRGPLVAELLQEYRTTHILGEE